MKACHVCQRLYDDDAGFCPIDGKPLAAVDEVDVPPDPDDPRIGVALCDGRYHVRRKVADGGMGRVYQALDTVEDRSVALKVLHQDVAMDDVAVERFKREYELSADLPHDHIVEVLDFEETEDESYALVMEYLEGEELRMVLKRDKRVSFARLLRILSQLAIGLEAPHQRKLVHRDIKPDNIFLCGKEDGDLVKLLDFGSVRDNAAGATKLTVVGTTIGSPFYMAPEQAQGLLDLDHRADVWSLCAIAYECMTGEVPFHAPSGPAILLKILGHEPAPPSVVGARWNVPPTVDEVMEDGLAKDASMRIGSMGELADRFGHAFGLEGSHRDWAYQPERELSARIEQRLPELLVPRPPPSPAGEPDAGSSPPADGTGPFDNPFAEDEDFVMGVPTGPPQGLYIVIGLLVLALAAGLIVLLV